MCVRVCARAILIRDVRHPPVAFSSFFHWRRRVFGRPDPCSSVISNRAALASGPHLLFIRNLITRTNLSDAFLSGPALAAYSAHPSPRAEWQDTAKRRGNKKKGVVHIVEIH